MTPIDRNPRRFYLSIIDIDVTLATGRQTDHVTIRLAGHITPTVRERLAKALREGNFEIVEKRLV